MAEPIASLPVPTGIALTPLDALFRDDPYPVLAELREREPIHHDVDFERWIFTRHEAAETINALLDRFKNLEFGSGDEASTYDYASNPSFRGLSRFMIRGERAD